MSVTRYGVMMLGHARSKHANVMKTLAVIALRLGTLAVAEAVIHYCYFAFFVIGVHGADGVVNIITDGWGRPLTDTPSLLRGLLPEFDMWAGWGWAVVDFAVIFFGGFGIGGGLWYFSSRLNSD